MKEKKSEFAKPLSILKSKPLKSEKDLIKKNSEKDKKVSTIFCFFKLYVLDSVIQKSITN